MMDGFATLKKITIEQAQDKIIFRNTIFFLLLIAIQQCWIVSYLESVTTGQEIAVAIGIFIFFGLAITYCTCFCELRLVGMNGEYVFPTAQFIFFYGKAVIFFVAFIVNIMTILFIDGILLRILVPNIVTLLSIATFYIIVMQAFKKKKLEEKIYIDYKLEKLKNAVSLRKFIVGIIISSVMLIGSVVMLSLSVKSNASGGELGEHISDFVLTTTIATILVVFYIVSAIKYQKGINKATIKETKKSDN